MTRLFAAAICAILSFTGAAGAQERGRIGYGHLLTNDVFGDGHDRWRTGSYATSRVWGPGWDGQLPQGFGEILELRFNGEIISPETVGTPAPGDRPFAGVLSLGLHTHFERARVEYAVGADIVLTGPMTQMDEVQSLLHGVLGGRNLSTAVKNGQVGNDVNPTLVAEAGRSFELGPNARLRPFVEGRWGLETLARVGADLTIGRFGQGELLVREPVTGHRYRAVKQPHSGLSFVLGADVAHVADSELISSARGLQPTDSRNRVRAGVNWLNRRGVGLFYGVTWLDKEFKTQADDQVVGSLRLHVNF